MEPSDLLRATIYKRKLDMNRLIGSFLITTAFWLGTAAEVYAWGRGGAVGGYRAGGFAAGGYRAGGYAAGGYRAGGVAAGGYHAGAYAAGGYAAGGYRAGGYAAGGVRSGEVGATRYNFGGTRYDFGGARYGAVGSHTALASDFGFGHVAGYAGARGYVGAGHVTTAYAGGALAARGAAVRGGYYRYGAFNTGWWGVHPGAWRPYGWDAARAWGWANWGGLTNWFGWSAAPVVYDYGTNIVYQGDQVYIDDQQGPTAAVYYQQAADLAQSVPVVPPSDEKGDAWLPLGVFSLVQGEQSEPSAVFQLAVDKAGTIRGNYSNALTDTTLPVRGAVDQKTQRASWVVDDQKATVYDTGIANLTKDESPLLIHFGQERTEQWLLVRIKESDARPQTAAVPMVMTEPPPGDNRAKITVTVPADAEVYFDGTETTETGSERVFTTPPLAPGTEYTYSIRAVWTKGGKPVEQTRKVTFQAGAQVLTAFTGSDS
jgi:uncharacterized protein (TIGR03000 family)